MNSNCNMYLHLLNNWPLSSRMVYVIHKTLKGCSYSLKTMSVQQYTQLHFSVILPDECGKATKVTAGAYHSAALTGKGLLSSKFLA